MTYSRSPLMSLIRERMTLQLQASRAGQGIDDMVEQVLHLLVGGGHGVDVELVAAGHPVDLGDGGAGLQPGHGLPKAPGGELQLKVAGHRPR